MPGRAVAVQADNPKPFTLYLGSNAFMSAIATSVGLDQSVSAQISTTLGNQVFVTPFGDNPSMLSVSFILNGKNCTDPETAVESFLSAYQSTKVGPSQNKYPKMFIIGGAAYDGYIVSARLNASSDGGSRMLLGTLSAVVWAVNA